MKNRLRRLSAKLPIKKLLKTTLLFALAFCAGRLTAQVVEYNRGLQTADYASAPQAVTTSADGNWGLSFPGEGQMPIGNATADYLKQYNAYYAQNTQDKVIYLTFDAGYENGNTAAILDALKKHNVHATFFLVGNYIETSPDLVKRMVAEGHTVGNHTFHHPDIVERKAVFCEFSAGRLPALIPSQLLNQNHISAQDRAGTGVIGPLAAAFCKIVISRYRLTFVRNPVSNQKIIRMIASQRY